MLNRYDRHLALDGFDESHQIKLTQAKIIVIGAGGLGSPALFYLAGSGVGNLTIVDPDHVSLTNLQRQILFDENDIAKLKVDIAQQKLQQFNSEINISVVPAYLDESNAASLLKGHDLIIDCSDNFETRHLIDRFAIELDIPWVYGGIEGYKGQVSVFNYCNGPAYKDLFTDKSDAGSCNEIGVLGSLAGIIGSVQASEALKVITGLGNPLSGRIWLYDLLTNTTDILNFSPIKEISHDDSSSTTQAINFDNYQIVDLRESWEFEEFNIGGINLPFANVLSELKLPTSEKQILLICDHGNKSKIVQKKLRAKNIRVESLEGGIQPFKKMR